jgi:hypothetical protein
MSSIEKSPDRLNDDADRRYRRQCAPGGAGADTLRQAAAATDTADYSASASAVTVNLATNVNTGGDAQGDSLARHREYHRLGL